MMWAFLAFHLFFSSSDIFLCSHFSFSFAPFVLAIFLVFVPWKVNERVEVELILFINKKKRERGEKGKRGEERKRGRGGALIDERKEEQGRVDDGLALLFLMMNSTKSVLSCNVIG